MFLICTLSISGLFVGFLLVISSRVCFHDRRALLYGIIIVLLSAAAFYYILGNELPMLRTVRSTNRGKAERLRSSQRVPIQMPESIGNSDFHSRASADIGILDPEGPKARYCSCLIVLQVIRESSLNDFVRPGRNVNTPWLFSAKQAHGIQVGHRNVAAINDFEHFAKRISGVC